MTAVVTAGPELAPAQALPADLGAWFAEHGLNSRATCRQAQLDLARRNERIISLEGDLGLPEVPFGAEFPDRYRQIGIAEANLVGVAAGLAMRGWVPLVNTFAVFATMRACEQVRIDLAYHRSNVKLVGFYTGLSGGWAGPTHHCLEDIAITRALPGMTVLSPADAWETYQATVAAAEWDGPVYLRVGRAATPAVYRTARPFRIGEAVVLREGTDAAILATGCLLVAEALRAAELLEADGVRCRVVNVHTLKPLDEGAVLAAASDTGLVVTVEDHNVHGGLGSAVASLLAGERPTPVERLGVADRFCRQGAEYPDLLALQGIAAEDVRRRVLARLGS